jgi:hypothetical protein
MDMADAMTINISEVSKWWKYVDAVIIHNSIGDHHVLKRHEHNENKCPVKFWETGPGIEKGNPCYSIPGYYGGKGYDFHPDTKVVIVLHNYLPEIADLQRRWNKQSELLMAQNRDPFSIHYVAGFSLLKEDND